MAPARQPRDARATGHPGAPPAPGNRSSTDPSKQREACLDPKRQAVDAEKLTASPVRLTSPAPSPPGWARRILVFERAPCWQNRSQRLRGNAP